jgi:bifunctional N-acetylglucosamine-1-phosphate-uridyltransferase/glucosamine-1-phosphate-acetyltransferase GlmU-like protein
MLVAPVRVGARSMTAAGSVVTKTFHPILLSPAYQPKVKKNLK